MFGLNAIFAQVKESTLIALETAQVKTLSGLRFAAGILFGAAIVLVTGYFALHSFLYYAISTYFTMFAALQATNAVRSPENKTDPIGFTTIYVEKAKDCGMKAASISAPIVFAAGRKTGEVAFDSTLYTCSTACCYLFSLMKNCSYSLAAKAKNKACEYIPEEYKNHSLLNKFKDW